MKNNNQSLIFLFGVFMGIGLTLLKYYPVIQADKQADNEIAHLCDGNNAHAIFTSLSNHFTITCNGD